MVKKAKLCYMDTDSFILYIKADDIYKNIAEDIETRFDTSNYELDRPFPRGKNKKGIGLRTNTYVYLIDNASVDKKAKGTKK